MEDLRCVVTGGAGFIETLLENNVSKVTIIDNMTTGNIENLKNLDHDRIELVCGDIRTLDMKPILENHDYLFHEAALISVFESIEQPKATNKTNIDLFNHYLPMLFQKHCLNYIHIHSHKHIIYQQHV